LILACCYLYSSYARSRLSIPILDRQKRCFYGKNLIFKKNSSCSTTNSIQQIQKKYNNKNKRDIYYTNNFLKNLPYISIIIPARNEENHIERCRLSLLSQDYPYFEVIVIDDNSSDDTLKKIHEIKNNKYLKTLGVPLEKLKIISIKEKPNKWSGKTWASQKGYMESKGSVILFTDADTHYARRDVILQTVLYMQKENLDVLTGIPSPEKLINFWSKIAIPLWDSVSVLFGVDSADVNNPKSKIPYLIGCFFLIKREVFLGIGTFESVHDAIQEDKALGVLIKKRGYKMKLVRLKEMIYTLWAEDLLTLWHGIGRTLALLVMKNKVKVILILFIIFFASVLPFAILPITLSLNFENGIHDLPYKIPFDFCFGLTLLNLISCIIMTILVSKKCKEYGIAPIYSLSSLFASIFVIVACLYNKTPLLLFGNTKPILWQGRRYTYNKKQEGFTI
jgi:cellulose synthase/poly-beta-1,6-N-acetylglucosamine synthase-like glycosyltransferase